MRKKPFVTILLCNLFTALTVLFFSPMEVILANAGEFFFPFGSVWWFQLLVTLAAALLLTGLFCLLPSRVGLVFAAGVLGIGVAAYLQTYPFMNSLMPSLTGKAIRISAAGRDHPCGRSRRRAGFEKAPSRPGNRLARPCLRPGCHAARRAGQFRFEQQRRPG